MRSLPATYPARVCWPEESHVYNQAPSGDRGGGAHPRSPGHRLCPGRPHRVSPGRSIHPAASRVPRWKHAYLEPRRCRATHHHRGRRVVRLRHYQSGRHVRIHLRRLRYLPVLLPDPWSARWHRHVRHGYCRLTAGAFSTMNRVSRFTATLVVLTRLRTTNRSLTPLEI